MSTILEGKRREGEVGIILGVALSVCVISVLLLSFPRSHSIFGFIVIPPSHTYTQYNSCVQLRAIRMVLVCSKRMMTGEEDLLSNYTSPTTTIHYNYEIIIIRIFSLCCFCYWFVVRVVVYLGNIWHLESCSPVL